MRDMRKIQDILRMAVLEAKESTSAAVKEIKRENNNCGECALADIAITIEGHKMCQDPTIHQPKPA